MLPLFDTGGMFLSCSPRCSVQTTLQAVIDSVRKSYECHEAEPLVWLDIRLSGRALLPRRELERYRDLMDLQDEWESVVDDPEKYVSLLIGQKGDDEQRAESNEENHHDTSEAGQTTQIFFLAYH